ncbi:MAG: TonB-dependent receptor [Bacteroidetes bacterium]|nr:TonB-dependent receptor [Bacteroidota bacterium]
MTSTTRSFGTVIRNIVVLFFLPLFGIAQTKPALTGKIIDGQTKQPIHAATISLLHKDSSTAAQVISRPDGTFTLNGLSETAFLLRVSVVGYQPFVQPVPAGRRNAGVPVDMGAIRLTPLPAQMQTVTVVGSRAAMRSEIDKRVFNVTGSLASKGGTASDALRQVPTLSVDAAGNVSLRNGSPVILIDGKRTQLTLDQIPSDQIQSIEVMPNPSAKYDAQGNHGIVNIILKKNRQPGFNGSVTGVWSTLHETYEFLNLNAYKKKWNFTFNYMGHSHRSVQNTTTTLQSLSANTTTIQRGNSVTTGPFNMFKTGADYFMDAHNSFSLSGNIGFGSHPTSGTQTTEYLTAGIPIDSTGRRSSYDRDHFVFTHVNFDYSHSFAKSGEKLTTSAALETYHGTDAGRYEMQYLDKGSNVIGAARLQQFNGLGDAHNLTLQTDYTDPLRDGNARFETGIKTILHGNHSYNNFNNILSQGPVVDSAASYNYRYNDNTYAAYASYSDQYGKFSYMAGLRLEKYDYTGHLLDANSSFGFHQTGLYPSVYLTERLDQDNDVHLNYSRRVNRPQWWQITPETNYSNPQNPQVGNPHIRPENTNLFELAYNSKLGAVGINSTLYWKNTLNPMMSYNIPLSKDTLLSTFENGNSINTYGAELIVKLPVTGWWNATTNFNLFATDINADNLSQGLSNSGVSWFAKLNSDMKVFKAYTFQVTGNYNAANVVAQGKVLASGGMDIAIKRDFLKDNAATLVVSLSDVFNTQQTRVDTYSQGQFFQESIGKPETRVLKINFTYSFGRELNGQRHKATSGSNG